VQACYQLRKLRVDYGATTGRNWYVDTPSNEVAIHFAAQTTTIAWGALAQLPNWECWEKSQALTASHQPDLLRDIFGNPFRPVTADPRWLTDSVVAMAQTMYDSRDFGQMPALADALQAVECDNSDILEHCRHAPLHVRGCWVVDLLLGKS
jgi:hypothetical protein